MQPSGCGVVVGVGGELARAGCESRGGGDRDRANEARAGGGERRVGCERNSTEAVVVGKGKGYYKGGNRVEMTRREGGNAGRTGGRRV